MQLTNSYSQNNTEKFWDISDILDNSKGDSEEDINSQKYFKSKKEEHLPRNRNETVC